MNAVAVAHEIPWYNRIEPRYIHQNQALTAAHLAGSTKKVLRRKKLSTTKGNAQGKSKLVSYVPLQMLHDAGITVINDRPETNPHVTVNQHQKIGSYKNFSWILR